MADSIRRLGETIRGRLLNDTQLGLTPALFPRQVRGFISANDGDDDDVLVYEEITRRLLAVSDVQVEERVSQTTKKTSTDQSNERNTLSDLVTYCNTRSQERLGGRPGETPDAAVTLISSELSSILSIDGPLYSSSVVDITHHTVRNLDANKVAFVKQSDLHRTTLTTALQKRYPSVMVCWDQSLVDTLTVALGLETTPVTSSTDLQALTCDVDMIISRVFREITVTHLAMSPKIRKEVNKRNLSTCLPHTSEDVLVIPSEDMSGYIVTGTSREVTSVIAALQHLAKVAEEKCIIDLAQMMVKQRSAPPCTQSGTPNERRISVERSILMFLQAYRSQKIDLIHKLPVGISFDLDTNAVIIRGQEGHVEEAVGQIGSLISEVVVYSYMSRKAGAKKYFRSPASKQTIESAGKSYVCVVDMIEDYPERNDETQVVLKVGDLHTTKADVIVNSTNEKLDMTAGPLTMSLVCVGGAIIQTQCQELYPHGIKEGDVVNTGPGNLRCKELYHCCLPAWKSDRDSGKVLRQTIRQCLRKASEAEHSSIAFPALGTGNARYPAEVVARVFRDEVREYLISNPCCSLKEVVVVLFHKDENTLEVFKKTYGDHTLQERVNPVPGTEVQNGSVNTTSFPSASDVFFKVGDLAKTEADVIVNTTNEKLDLSAGPLTKSLVGVGGAILQTQCKKLYPHGIKEGEVAKTGPGNLRCTELYHCCLPEWKSDKYTGKLLRLTIHQCLHKAAAGNHGSIAFPALGTGLRKYPAEVVAAVFRDVVKEYHKSNPHSSLKDIGVVLFEKDRKTIEAFNAICRKKTESESETFPPDMEEQREFHLGNLQLGVKAGDVLDEEVDAVVLPTDNMAVPNPKIRRSGTAFVRRQDRASMIAVSREFFGYDVERIITKCLRKADKKKVVSVAIPHIADNTPEDLFNFAFIRCILNIVNSNDRLGHVRHVILVLTDTVAVEETTRMFQDYFGKSCVKRLSLCRKPSHTLDNERDRTIHEELHLRIVSSDRKNINKCRQFLDQQLGENLCAEDLHSDVIYDLTDKQEEDIKQTCADMDVEAKVDIENRLVRHSGLKTDVEKAKSKTGELLKDIEFLQIHKERAEFLRQFVQWWSASSQGAVKVSAVTNLLIEEAYFRRLHQPTSVVETLIGKVNIDFSTMELIPQNRPEYKHKLSRKQIPAMALPQTWDDMCGKDLIAPCVTSGPENDELTQLFTSSAGNGYEIVEIRRIQNILTYQQYQIQRQSVQSRNANTIIERRLWHGTRSDVLTSINRDGFNRSFNGKNGTKFGKGVYFATEASYSAQKELSPKDDRGFKYIYLCQVITGIFTKGDVKMLDAPFLEKGSSIRYDSVVDNVKRPTMHVVFRDTQSYPQYLFAIKEK
ncbi:protein mono-ADP-ribosyltransferase PARP14-like isoform X2 [Haliotis rufescens]|uniref:protein mono-ADP-ribosyltransferase PARP14-like isoform X2 n=1 Tax=Haliotis rufescens TaxID=6454 RepID=UPI00201F9F66|nr:protein mono-ADP-ribosyltransferase PARP14-like isoform X2 [Haliotis rufescens]